MRILFNVYCNTTFGQNLKVVVGGEAYPMAYTENAQWKCEVDSNDKDISEYQYILTDVDGSEIYESPIVRALPKTAPILNINDEFRAKDISSVFRTVPFVDALCRQKKVSGFPKIKKDSCLVSVNVPAVEPEQGVAIIGDSEVIGGWNAEKKIQMTAAANADWFIQLPTNRYLTHSEFKFVVYDRKSGEIVRWEDGDNRRFQLLNANSAYSYTFRQTVDWHGAGVAIPVFSLRSDDGWGVGEFADLKYMVDWAVKRNLKLIQILPINDTTFTFSDADSYPYCANSVYALHPMYLNMKAVGALKDKRKYNSFIVRAKALNEKSYVDYSAVNALKMEYLRLLFEQDKNIAIQDSEFIGFVSENVEWLKPYAAFCFLRDKYQTAKYVRWEEFAVYDNAKVDSLSSENQDYFNFCYYIQFNLSKQLTEVRRYAHDKGVVLKGDLPIGVSADSVDAWMFPHLFNLNKCAGAPPDDFSEKGQNWGFPTYNWREMEKDGYSWWRKRFANMSSYFDAFRIDHILGFFRIWEIPAGAVWGLLGHFNPALPMSVSEIEQYGMWFDVERLTKPYIDIDNLARLIPDGAQRDKTADKYLNRRTIRLYSFKEAYDTQEKLLDSFRRNNIYESEKELLDILLSLHTEVLFIEDENRRGHYNPRISVIKTDSFAALDSHLKWCISRIHDEYYYHRHNEFWYGEAMRKLPALLRDNNMLVCGEDLGMVPACVPEVMRRLFILSLEIERMPKDVRSMFATPDKTPYLSVSSTGTHDMSTLRGWWRENRQLTQHYYNEVLGLQGEAPEECTPEIARMIVERQLSGNSMWAILPWQDFIACDEKLRCDDIDRERINIPDNPDNFWCYRMHISLNSK